ncbi:PAS domain S-box protein [Allocoleopsis franciscana]|uniref:PAS domain S-box n=1 Tax=Allocoleopsis franciscana PCC 7113 TaxID=1173027 RepID=K9WL46_9CYAN|nr:PAS domain S-box protein [Allocoleopsis franciscana]AFZ20504.1 PAS domain S-box [Allocoleopsis franciscana PCC 7113]
MANQEKSRAELEQDVQELRERLEVAEETLRAITQGEVDALVVCGAQGEQIFTLQSADYPYRRFVEEMKEGAATVNAEGMILYCNNRLTSWLKHPLEKIIGSDLQQYILPQDQLILQTLFQQAQAGVGKGKLSLRATDGTEIPVQVSISTLTMNDVKISGLIVTDLTEQKRNEKIITAQTVQLIRANTQLQQELQERQKVEEALQENQSVLNAIIEGTTDIIAALDLDYKYIAFNSAAKAEMLNIFGREIEIGTNLIEALAHLPEEQAKVAQIWSRALAGEEFTIIQEFGDTVRERNYYEITFSSIRDKNGQRIGASHIAKNISDRLAIEQVLRESEERFRNAFDYAPIGKALVALDGRFLKVNRSLCEITGYSEQELLATTFQALTHPNDLDIDLDYANQLLSGEIRSYQMEKRYFHKQGHIVWILLSGCLVRDHQGQPLYFIAQIQDITERKRSEEALQESEAKLKAILDNVPGFVYLKDLQGRHLMVNRYCLEAFHITPEQLVGKTNAEFFPPELAQRIEENDREVLQTGMPCQYEEEVLLDDGIHTQYSVKFPLLDASGEPYAICGISTDISDRKFAEKELELQAVITRNMAEGICLVRADNGVIVYANPKFERMFGYNPGELNGKHVSIVNYADESMGAEEVNQAIRREVLQHGEATYEVHNVKKDGTPFWCRATTSIFDHPEYGTVLVAVHQDITEHKQAADLIKASLKEKEVLLKEIHHRVKNNLQIVTSLLQMQARRTKEPQAVEVLRDSKNRIASIALVHEKLYRSEDLANIDFGQYIPDLTTHLFDTYNVSSNTVSLNINVENILLQIDTAIPCGLIINELVSNSLKYAFPANRKGEIQIEFYSNKIDENLTLIVRDNGMGIPKEFDIETAHSLGLTLVQGLVEQLEGTIELDRHQGTEFKITFPGNKI